MKKQNILVCHLEGTFGHFRKFYTNSSSLSYSFPPPTTIAGLLAGIMGINRDEYYSLFTSENFRCAVEIAQPIRKILQTVNYLYVSSQGDVNGFKGHTQVPLELVASKEKPENNYSKLKYRLYITHRDKTIYSELKKRLQQEAFVYPPYLGISECTGSLTLVEEIEAQAISIIPAEEEVLLHSLCNIEYIQKGSLALNFNGTVAYVKELAPVEFTKERLLSASKFFVYEEEGQGIQGRFNVPILSFTLQGKEKNILWMQEVSDHDPLFSL